MQAKDWFTEILNKTNITVMGEWKKHNVFPEPMTFELESNKNYSKKVTVIPIHLLITTNTFNNEELMRQLKQYGLGPSEGIGSIQEMLTWLPTAGYVCQLAEKLRQIFPHTIFDHPPSDS
jgi:hypothetical protein